MACSTVRLRYRIGPRLRAQAADDPAAPALRLDPRFNTGRLRQPLTLQLPEEQRALLDRAQAQAQAQGVAVVEAEVVLPEALGYEATLPDGRLLAVLPHSADYPAPANRAVSGGMAVWRRNAAGLQEFALVHSCKMSQWSIPRGGADGNESPLQAAVARGARGGRAHRARRRRGVAWPLARCGSLRLADGGTVLRLSSTGQRR